MILYFLLVLPIYSIFALRSISWCAEKHHVWKWKQHNIHYIRETPTSPTTSSNMPAILLVHGFGSSSYHWRYNILPLAEYYDVYAIDLIGFGKSSKPLENYLTSLWTNQTLDFIENVIGKNTIVVGNSLGGSIALQSSLHDLVGGVILINSYVKFKNNFPSFIRVPRFMITVFVNNYFQYIQETQKIKDTLRNLYPVQPERVDDHLVESILQPSYDPNAPQVLGNIIENIMHDSDENCVDVEHIINTFEKPMLLIWGTQDAWISKEIAEKIVQLHPKAKTKFVRAGHCPQDEIPETVNEIMLQFLVREC